jgi:Fe-Mn family superoxide dismutase
MLRAATLLLLCLVSVSQQSLAAASHVPVQLPHLPYGFDALEPHMDTMTVHTHWDKHHRGYTTKTNAALAALDAAGFSNITSHWDLPTILSRLHQVPEPQRTALRNNGGGYENHKLFFAGLCAAANSGEPSPQLLAAITESFAGGLEAMKTEFSEAAGAVFGSGWTWLVFNAVTRRLEVATTPQQDSPLVVSGGKLLPVLALDVWEHAYYLKYKNVRPSYVQAYWQLVNWREADRLYAAALLTDKAQADHDEL